MNNVTQSQLALEHQETASPPFPSPPGTGSGVNLWARGLLISRRQQEAPRAGAAVVHGLVAALSNNPRISRVLISLLTVHSGQHT